MRDILDEHTLEKNIPKLRWMAFCTYLMIVVLGVIMWLKSWPGAGITLVAGTCDSFVFWVSKQNEQPCPIDYGNKILFKHLKTIIRFGRIEIERFVTYTFVSLLFLFLMPYLDSYNEKRG